MRKAIVFVALSGGVDSSVAAALLQRRGFTVVGVHLHCYNLDGCGERDAEDARRVAETLNIPFYLFDFENEYKSRVVYYLIEGYRKGITPNPDVMCNKEIKFGLFLKRALELGADYIATGHYVRKRVTSEIAKKSVSEPRRAWSKRSEAVGARARTSRRWSGESRLFGATLAAGPAFKLTVAKDKNKDQSYFLWTLTQEQLKHCLFPIGRYNKPEVRHLARKFGLPTAEKKDSQGICFLGKVTLTDFLKNYIPEEQGLILTTTGEQIGEHRGAHYYTIGQRHGFRIKNYESRIKVNTKPYYVVDKDIGSNTLIVAADSQSSALYKKEVQLTGINFINPLIRNSKFLILPCFARLRYRQPLVKAILRRDPSTSLGFRLIFDKAQKFVAPGQSAVFYSQKGELLGGGIIVDSK